LNEGVEGFSRRHREGLFSALSAGFFFVLVGVIFVTTPDLFEKISVFFRNFTLVPLSPNLREIRLPAPSQPWTHSVVYLAAKQFSFVWGLFQIVILVFRFFARSPFNKKAETVSNLVFWLGAGFLISMFLNDTTTRTTWFEFWSGIIMLLGLSLIVRAIILAAKPTKGPT